MLAGAHSEPDRTYKRGEIVETETDLIKVFGKDKFEEVGVKAADPDEEIDPTETKVVVDGARSGVSSHSTSQSATTADSSAQLADWATNERAGKGAEVVQPPEPPKDRDEKEKKEKKVTTVKK